MFKRILMKVMVSKAILFVKKRLCKDILKEAEEAINHANNVANRWACYAGSCLAVQLISENASDEVIEFMKEMTLSGDPFFREAFVKTIERYKRS